MKYFYSIFLVLLTFLPDLTAQSCLTDQNTLIIKITTDRFGRETSWVLSDTDSIYREVKRNEYNGALVDTDTFCIDKEACLFFSIFDGFGDGIPDGGYELFLNGELIAQNKEFGFSETVELNCQEGTTCSTAIPIEEGEQETFAKDTWYVFTPDTIGTYEISTCEMTTCDTRIFVYDRCESFEVGDSEGFIFFNDDACGSQSKVNALLDASQSYLIRISNKTADCEDNTITWRITYKGPIAGCMDASSCNYNPLATVSDNSCLPFGDPNCPKGPDLRILEDILSNSIVVDTINNTDDCLVNEGCLKGFGRREIIRFTTRFENIGEQDYFIGVPSLENNQFTFDNCHNHFHYDNYAEYLLYDDQGNRLPAGFKSGFCVVDLVCEEGRNKYGCNNMGLTVGCFDEYASFLDCQWIDVTEYPDGNYTFVARVNWGNEPDAIGRVEQDLTNNWAQVCLTLDRSSGTLIANVNADCPNFVDCEGTPFGSAEKDCLGVCGGTALYADVDGNSLQDQNDVQELLALIQDNAIEDNPCYDLNQDGQLTIYDAALLSDCLNFGTQHEHVEQGLHDHCDFPGGILNALDTVTIKIHAFDASAQTIDLAMRNDESNVVAFQLRMKGIAIQSAESLLSGETFPVQLRISLGTANIMGLVQESERSIEKNRDFQPFLRIHYLDIEEAMVCIDQIAEIINGDFQQVIPSIEEGCISVMLTNTEELATIKDVVSIFPNPTKEQCTITFPNPEYKDFNLKVFNATGKIIQHHKGLKTNTYSLSTHQFPSGIYFIHLSHNTKQYVTKLAID